MIPIPSEAPTVGGRYTVYIMKNGAHIAFGLAVFGVLSLSFFSIYTIEQTVPGSVSIAPRHTTRIAEATSGAIVASQIDGEIVTPSTEQEE